MADEQQVDEQMTEDTEAQAETAEDVQEPEDATGPNAPEDDFETDDDTMESEETAAAEPVDPEEEDVDLDVEEGLEPVETLSREESRQALYAMLFASDRPLSAGRLAEALGDADHQVVANLLGELQAELDEGNQPFVLREIGGGYQLSTRPQYAPFIRRLFQIKKRNRLSKAVLETLAIIAFKQPVTRADVEAIRGVSVSHAFQVLEEKRLIKVSGVAETPGRPKLYRTTDEFLLHFGLKSLKELPSISELRELR